MKPKTVQQIIDGQERRRPLEKGFGAAIAESKRKTPESAWWHMRHRPYEVGGDANGNDEGAAGGVQELQGRDQGAAV